MGALEKPVHIHVKLFRIPAQQIAVFRRQLDVNGQGNERKACNK
jgi:hypothetical protein